MSRIYFHNIEETADVSGAERGLLGQLCSRALLLTLGKLDYAFDKGPWIMKHIPSDCYLHDCRDLRARDIEIWLSVDNSHLLLDGEKHKLFDLQLNSAIILGGNAMKLAARLHGQCEIHCYVEGKNRAWLADMVDDAVAKKVFRTGRGWDSVVTLLRKASDTPVVCSYSVCEQFPNSHIANWEPAADDPDGDAWYDLPAEEKWEKGMAGLRSSGHGLEITPDDWDSFYFGRSFVTGFDFSNRA